MRIIPHTNIETLADAFIADVLAKDNFAAPPVKGGFVTGGSMIVCESRGLQEYLQKRCVDAHGIWTALPFRPLAGLLMRCAYTLSPADRKQDDLESVYGAGNLVWAIYRLLEGREKVFSFAGEVASLFLAYQIYRPELIEAWDKGRAYKIPAAGENFVKNEIWQRELWTKLKAEYRHEQTIYDLYKYMESELKNPASEKKGLPERIFIFAPLSIAPVHLKTLTLLANAGSAVNLYLHLISGQYIADTKSEKSIVYLRKKSWTENEKIVNEKDLYWDLGNRLIANLGRSAQVLYEQIGWENLEPIDEERTADSLLEKIQADIINDENIRNVCEKDDSITVNNCFSPLREIEVLRDYVLDLFVKKGLTPADIAVVSPNMEIYASAIDMVFGIGEIPYRIADRDIKKYDKTSQLLNMLFSQIGGRYESADILALFEHSMFVQERELESNDIELIKKWIGENAVRHGLESFAELPNYSFEIGFDQLAAGFFMISETEFSDKNEYCYPDIEGGSARILGDFVCFVRALKTLDDESRKEHSIEEWDSFLKENLQIFFGADETDFNEDRDTPYQKVTGAWDSLKKEMLKGFSNADIPVSFTVLKSALPEKMDAGASSLYSLNGMLSFSNIETVRAVPHRVICCIGMNGKEFPRRLPRREISIISAAYQHGDKDPTNEYRLIFLETICGAKEALYISWIGQSEKNADELEPSSAVVMFLKNLKEQYGIEDIVVKHPIQPFSKKYYNGTLSTYDKRWDAMYEARNAERGKSVWEWEVDSVETKEEKDINNLCWILAYAPEYFLKTVCGVELPEDIGGFENIEPFIVEGGLEEWKLADLILNRNYERAIEIKKLRGELPKGIFADNIIGKIKDEAEKLKKHALNETPGAFYIYPSKDKGKYRLKHWLYHLDLNSKKKEYQDTKMFLKGKDATVITLSGLSKERADKLLNNLWGLKEELGKKLLPIFPDAAWEYLYNTGSAKGDFTQKKRLSNAWDKLDPYSKYTEMVKGDAQSFMDLGVENEFIEYSNKLFEGYNGDTKEIKNETA